MGGAAVRWAAQLGGSFGAAILTTVLQQQLITQQGPAGQATAFDHAFSWALALATLASVPALLLPRATRHPPRQAEPAPASAARQRA
jgi:hypothetical protein